MNLTKVLCWCIFKAVFLIKVQGAKFNPLAHVASLCQPAINMTSSDVYIPGHVIATPLFDGSIPYDNNINCGFLFKTVNGTGLFTLQFHVFDLEEAKTCAAYDYVKIYRQGKGQTDWDLLKNTQENGYCGHLKGLVVMGFGEAFFVHFYTDESDTGAGFNASYKYTTSLSNPIITCVGEENDALCGRQIEAKETGGINLKCTVESNEETEIIWYKRSINDLPLRTDMVKARDDVGGIQLEELLLEDEGTYVCMANNKNRRMEEEIQLKIIQKCNCPKEVLITWHNYPPYTPTIKGFTKKQVPIYGGIFYKFIEKMIRDVCGNCERGHGWSYVNWNGPLNRKKNLRDVKLEMLEEFDVALPILNGKDEEKYGENYFVAVTNAPGYVIFEKLSSNGGEKVFAALFTCWPVLAITVLMMIVAGIIIWFLEMKANGDEFPSTFLAGIRQGIWWAYITMTTVGYGDISPRSYFGRVFAVLWIMAGLVIISILTGAISAGLYIASQEVPIDIYGTKMAAIAFSEEFSYAMARNGQMSVYKDFQTMVDEIKPVDTEKSKIEAIIVDSYVAGYYKELHKLKKNKVITMDDMKYGIVLGGQMNTREMRVRMDEYVKEKIVMIGDGLMENVNQVPNNPGFDMMDPNSVMYMTAVITMAAMLLLFSLCGLGFEYGYLRPRQREVMAAKNLDMIESTKVKNMAKNTTIMRDLLLEELKMHQKQVCERIDDLNELHVKQKQFFQENKDTYAKDAIEMQDVKKTKHSK